jgi:hypothetical protein
MNYAKLEAHSTIRVETIPKVQNRDKRPTVTSDGRWQMTESFSRRRAVKAVNKKLSTGGKPLNVAARVNEIS